jgi:hypothetical protein
VSIRYFCAYHGIQDERPCPKCKKRRQRGRALQERRKRVIAAYGGHCAAYLDDGTRCQVRAPLEVHHFDHNVENNAFDNQIPLCKDHHRRMPYARRSDFAEPSVLPWIA